MSKYVAESITMIAGRFGHEGLCQLRTELKKLIVDTAPLHVEVAVLRVLPHSITVVHVNIELGPPLGGSEAVYPCM